MSLLLVFVDGPEPEARARARQRALAAAARQGFANPQRITWPGGQALWFATPGQARGNGACVEQGAAFAALCGTVHGQGLAGEALLRKLLNSHARPQDMPLRDLSGGFAMVFSQGDAVWLFQDAVGLQRLYGAASCGVYATSWLVCRAALQRPSLNRLRAQEYVLLGGNHACATAVEGVEALDPAHALELREQRSQRLHEPAAWRSAHRFASPEQAVGTLTEALDTEFKGLLQAFGPNVGMALSGGFDSRLLLAGLDRQGCKPELYVYGADALDDVQVARAKAAELGLPIECIDKQRLNDSLPPLNADGLARSLAFFDGLPVDGIFDRGADAQTRQRQMAADRLNLNGGGGEILRNFFYLPARRYSALDLVDTFYSGWAPEALPDADERSALRQATADGILNSLGLPLGGPRERAALLERSEVELVYTLFRLRWWMARNNSVATRHGAFMTPLVQPRLVELAAQVPVGWKSFGELEAAIITRLSPRVAAGPSNYGFDFSQGPGAAQRRSVRATLWRPVAVRRAVPRIRRLLGRGAPAQQPAEWRQAWPHALPDVLHPAGIQSAAQWNRWMTLAVVLDDALCGASA